VSYVITKFILDLAGLTPAEKAVAHSLAYHAHADGAEAFPSMATIAAESGLTRRNAQRNVRRLEQKGVILAETPKSGGRWKATHYRFLLGNSVASDALSGKETASLETRNSVDRDMKQRRQRRPKGYERSEMLGAQKRATPLPSDFEPNDNNRAVAKQLGVDLKEALQAFKDFHLSKGSTYRNWNLALNTWLRNEKRFSRQPFKPQTKPTFDALEAFNRN
jgi:hypothetical protein